MTYDNIMRIIRKYSTEIEGKFGEDSVVIFESNFYYLAEELAEADFNDKFEVGDI